MKSRIVKAESPRKVFHEPGELLDGIAQNHTGSFVAGIRRGSDDRKDSREQIIGVRAGPFLHANPTRDAELPQNLFSEGGIGPATLMFTKTSN